MPRIDEFEDNINLMRHQIFNTIRMYNSMFREEYGELVICMDGKDNWRKKYFPNYKAARRANRKNSVHDWKMIFEEMSKITNDVKQSTPYRCVHVERCEADDVIGTIVENWKQPEPILILSPDGDFVQLQKYPNVKQYSNIQKKWVTPKFSPEEDLWNKILKGDVGDGVPNVLSDDDVFVNEGRQTPLRKGKIEALKEDLEALGTTVARRVIRNRNLVDLTRTPEDIKQEINEQFAKPAKGSMMSLMTMFARYEMKVLAESLQDFQTNK